MSAEGKVFYEFGNFRCDPREHLLVCDGKSLSLSPKSFEILITLIQNNGRLLTKDELMQRVRLTAVADQPAAALSHGQQRQLEIGMALAGAPRFILFDEPAAGLSPAERRELVALLATLPSHMGFIIIEHDLDVALRVVERVTVMHNGHVLKHGTPAEIEGDAEVQAIYIGGGGH